MGGVVTGLRARGRKRARHHNTHSCALMRLLDQSADFRTALLTTREKICTSSA